MKKVWLPRTPHPSAEYIIAWAQGRRVQWRPDENSQWWDIAPTGVCNSLHVFDPTEEVEFRILED